MADNTGTSESGKPSGDPESSSREYSLKVYDRILATVTALGLLVGAIWAFYLHIDAGRTESRHRKQELAMQIYKERQPLYHKLSEAAAKIAAAVPMKKKVVDINDAIEKYWVLYYGELILAEDDKVRQAQIGFSKTLLIAQKSDYMVDDLVTKAIQLSAACQEALDLKKLEESLSKNGNVDKGSSGLLLWLIAITSLIVVFVLFRAGRLRKGKGRVWEEADEIGH